MNAASPKASTWSAVTTPMARPTPPRSPQPVRPCPASSGRTGRRARPSSAWSAFRSCLVRLNPRKITATISRPNIANAVQPATTSSSSGACVDDPDDERNECHEGQSLSWLGDAGEQVVLGGLARDVAHDQLEVLGRPDLLLDLARDREPEAVGVDLGGVGEQRLVAHAEVVRARHPGGDPGVPLGLGLPLLEPLGPRRLQAVGEHRVVQRLHPRPVERVVVVELQRPATARPSSG